MDLSSPGPAFTRSASEGGREAPASSRPPPADFYSDFHSSPAGRFAPPFRFRILPPGFLFIALTLAFGIQAVLTGNNLLFLLVAMMTGFCISLAVLTLAMPFRIEARRFLPGTVCAGDRFDYTLEIHNRRRWGAAYCLWVSDHYQPATGTRSMLEVSRLRPGQTLKLIQTVESARRGWLTFDGLRLGCHFPFGLFEAHRDLRMPNQLLVFPQWWTFHAALRLPGLEGGVIHSSHSGRLAADHADFAGLREFQPGDHPRLIHWHASGRFPNQILARQFEQRGDRHRVIILDSFYRREEEALCRAALEDHICLALALIQKFLAALHEVTFAGWSAGPRVFHLSPVSADLLELRRWLATVEPDAEHALPDLMARVRLPAAACGIVLRLPGHPEWRTGERQRWQQFTPADLKPFAQPRRAPPAPEMATRASTP